MTDAVDQRAREMAHDVAGRLDGHEDRCGDRYEVINKTLVRLEEMFERRLKELWGAVDGLRDVRRSRERDVIMVLAGIVVTVGVWAVKEAFG